jgi:hypothetical protein
MVAAADLIARLKAEVPALSGRVEGEAELAEMIRENRLPHVTPAANVIPLGLGAGPSRSMAGIFVQDVKRRFSILLTLRTHGQSHDRTEATLDELVAAVLAALLGWGPAPVSVGVFELDRAELRGMNRGTLLYQIDVSISDQLRIDR